MSSPYVSLIVVLLVTQLVLTSILVIEYILFCAKVERICDYFFLLCIIKEMFLKTCTLKLAVLILHSVF